jgi:hypothetical protein
MQERGEAAVWGGFFRPARAGGSGAWCPGEALIHPLDSEQIGRDLRAGTVAEVVYLNRT